MSDWTSLALFETTSWWQGPVYVLLGFVVGALVTGLAVQGATRLVTGRKLPGFFLTVVRVLGGITGCLIVLWGMSGGRGGLGLWPGGLGPGKGPGDGTSQTGQSEYTSTSGPKKTPEKEAEKEKPAVQSPVLRIEILGPQPLKKIEKENYDPKRCYRVNTKDGPKLMTLAELKKYIMPSSASDPRWKHIKIVIYKDSPAEIYEDVTDLEDWAAKQLLPNAKEKLQVDKERIDGNAPVS